MLGMGGCSHGAPPPFFATSGGGRMDSKDLAMDMVERGLIEVIPIINDVRSEHPDDRLLIVENALRTCVAILRGEK